MVWKLLVAGYLCVKRSRIKLNYRCVPHQYILTFVLSQQTGKHLDKMFSIPSYLIGFGKHYVTHHDSSPLE
jgi:hypothetical protein